MSDPVRSLAAVLALARVTRRELVKVFELPESALVEMRLGAQPPCLRPDVKQLHETVSSMCWSLSKAKDASELLERKTSAIRSSVMSRAGARCSAPERGHAEDKEEGSREEGEGEEEAEDLLAERDDIRARLVSLLRDALRTAQQPIRCHCAHRPTPICSDSEDGGGMCHGAEEAGKGPPRDGSPGSMTCEVMLRDLAAWYGKAAGDVGACAQVALQGACAPVSGAAGPEGPSAASSAASGSCTAAGEEPGREPDDDRLSSPFEGHDAALAGLQSQCASGQRAAEEWQQTHLLKGAARVIDSTDAALKHLRSLLLDGVLSLDGAAEDGGQQSNTLDAAAQALSESLKEEESFVAASAQQPSQRLVVPEAVASACRSRHHLLTRLRGSLDRIVAALAWAEEELGRQAAVAEMDYPPPDEELQDLERELSESQEKLDRAELELKYAGRRQKPTQRLEADAAEHRAAMKARRLDVRILRERTRLYALAQEHFPELLRPGHAWSIRVGLDASQAMWDLRRRGLLAEGRQLGEGPPARRL